MFMSSSRKLPQYSSIYKTEVLFLFSNASSTWLGDVGEVERRGSEALSWWIHSSHLPWTLCLRQLCTLLISWQFQETGK